MRTYSDEILRSRTYDTTRLRPATHDFPFVKRYCVEGKHLRFTVLESVLNRADANFAAILEREFGWGGRIRTFTVLINSEVSYQLDHAPAGDRGQRVIRRELKLSSRKNGREVFH
jgi:hypothetical protein